MQWKYLDRWIDVANGICVMCDTYTRAHFNHLFNLWLLISRLLFLFRSIRQETIQHSLTPLVASQTLIECENSARRKICVNNSTRVRCNWNDENYENWFWWERISVYGVRCIGICIKKQKNQKLKMPCLCNWWQAADNPRNQTNCVSCKSQMILFFFEKWIKSTNWNYILDSLLFSIHILGFQVHRWPRGFRDIITMYENENWWCSDVKKRWKITLDLR